MSSGRLTVSHRFHNIGRRRAANVAFVGGTTSALCAGGCLGAESGDAEMLNTILVLLVILWLLGMVSSYTLGGFIHLLLVLAIAVFLIRVIQGRNPV